MYAYVEDCFLKIALFRKIGQCFCFSYSEIRDEIKF